MAFALQNAGWQVVLLHQLEPNFNAANYFTEIHQYHNPWEALKLAVRYTPVVYHVFSNWNFSVASTFIRHKPGKIVFDDYDMMAGMVNEDFARKHYPGQIKLERFCLETADGLCCRSLETQYVKRYMGYEYSGKRIFFTDYCWNADLHVQKSIDDKCFTVANVGNLYIDENCDFNHPANYHLKLAVLLSQRNIRSYLFIASLTADCKLFLQKALAGNSYVRFGNMKYEQMLYKLHSQCQAGLICAPPSDMLMTDDAYRPTKRYYGVGNKLFDYVDAILPIVMDSESKFAYWLVKRYHKVFDFSVFISDLNECSRLIQNLWANNAEALSQARKALSVCDQVPRLIKFYEHF